MKKIKPICLIFAFSCAIYSIISCTFSENLKKGWSPVSINQHLFFPERDADDWTYPWYMVSHEDGSFENTLGVPITAQDTVKLIHLSDCYVFRGEDTLSRLVYTKAHLTDTVLHVTIFDESASNFEDLFLDIVDCKQFKPMYKKGLITPHDSITIQFTQQLLEINKPSYIKGDTLIGYLDISLEQRVYARNTYNLTSKRIKGVFEAVIE